jgi:hypothetical protein
VYFTTVVAQNIEKCSYLAKRYTIVIQVVIQCFNNPVMAKSNLQLPLFETSVAGLPPFPTLDGAPMFKLLYSYGKLTSGILVRTN